jgi:penicillin-binding protein 1A
MSTYNTRQQRRKQTSTKTKNTKETKKTKPIRKFFKNIFIFAFFIGLLGIVGSGFAFYSFVKDAPELDMANLKDPLSSRIYDRDGKLIYELGTQKRTKVSYDEIPVVVRNAFIATEDVRFFEHYGIDLKRIIGAVIANVTDGFGAEGASTITQQVVKNSFLTPEKSIQRKVQEQWLSLQIERKLTKEQILEIYLNKIYFANRAYGVAKAAETYFGKKLDELELHEAAMLAGMPQSPNNYDPFRHPEAAEKRRNIVLTLMAKHGFISQIEADQAKNIPVELSLVKSKLDTEPYKAFVDRVIDEVQSVTKEMGDLDISSSGLEIYTTMDASAQKIVEQILDTDEYKDIQYPNEHFQSGLVLLDTETGEIRAIGGGRKQKVERAFNYATDIKRQPGSTIKPIIDYGPAIEYLDFTSTYHQIVDEPYTYSSGDKISNWDNKYWGQMSIRKALAFSRNIPALKTIQTVGLDRARDFASGLGIPLNENIFESHAIGGFDGVSPLDLAGAYASFGNEGIYNAPHTVTKIIFSDETEINLKPKPEVAMSEHTAFMVTDMLESVVKYGTGTAANVSNLTIAGKTGTTNFDRETKQRFNISNGVPDIWFVGYTPELTLSIWTGYDKTTEENYISGSQKGIAKKIFKHVMENVSTEKGEKQFVQPNSVIKVGVEDGTIPAQLPSEYTPKDQIVYEYFHKDYAPTSVSTKYEKVTAPIDPRIRYDEVLDQIEINWNYDTVALETVTFEVSMAQNGGPPQIVANSKDLSYKLPNPERGNSYVFDLTAISDLNPENLSDTITVTIEIPEEIELIPDPFREENVNDEKREEENENNETDFHLFEEPPIDQLEPTNPESDQQTPVE